MVARRVKANLFIIILCFVISVVVPQYDHYSFRNFPEEELMPLASAYGLALDHYAARNWTESIHYMELSLRLHRLLRDSVRYCAQHCNNTRHEEEPSFKGNGDLHVHWHVMMRASCLKKCRANFHVLSLPYPRKEIMDDFERRSPYRYLHFAHFQVSLSILGTYDSNNDCLLKQHSYHSPLKDFNSNEINVEGVGCMISHIFLT